MSRKLNRGRFPPFCERYLILSTVHEADLWDGGITFHELCWILCAIFTVLAFILASIIMIGHATHYSNPNEQR